MRRRIIALRQQRRSGRLIVRQLGVCAASVSRVLRRAEVLVLIDDAGRFLGEANLEALDQAGLHELVDRLQLEIQGIHDGIAQSHFPSRDGANGPLLVARARELAQSQSLR